MIHYLLHRTMVLVVAIVIADSGVHVLSSKVRNLHICHIWTCWTKIILVHTGSGSLHFFFQNQQVYWVFPTCIASISPSIAALQSGGTNAKEASTYVKVGWNIGPEPAHPYLLQTAFVNGYHFRPDRILGLWEYTIAGILNFAIWLPKPCYIAQMVNPM